MPLKLFRCLLVLSVLITLSACASRFPTPDSHPFTVQDVQAPSGADIFNSTFKQHGGEQLAALNDVSVGLTGKWKRLITKIQPLVTDFTYRVDSQERLLPKERVYAAHYQGPAGTKSVFRSPAEIQVHYNDEPSQDPQVLSSTALTADAFHLFLLGPLALADWAEGFTRIADKKLNGAPHYRVYLERQPGFGFADVDEIVLWVNKNTNLTSMVQITLLGHDTTKAAHVEVEYLNYLTEGAYTFPSQFFERVNAPIAIDAHAWELTGLKINSGYTLDELKQPGFAGNAKPTAEFRQ